MIKMSRQKFKYLENENSFKGEIKDIFIMFKGRYLKQMEV